jgi:hypothetical protein
MVNIFPFFQKKFVAAFQNENARPETGEENLGSEQRPGEEM